jgi:predicted metal-dependent HD superfamily phosphohydrolase
VLKELFTETCKKFSSDSQQAGLLWNEIEKAYSNKKRHYHNLSHLQNLLAQLEAVQQDIKNWDAVLFALFYHDAVYNVLKKDNEEKSALLAVKRLATIGCSELTTQTCSRIILATKRHDTDANQDINYFTDADLSILGAAWSDYQVYAQNVRKEYALYPDIIYNPGRRKVLEHFLSMKQIFKTAFFFDRFELQANINLKKEIESLS